MSNIAVSVAVVAVLGLIAWLLSKSKAQRLANGAKRIRTSRVVMITVMIGCGLMAAGGVAGIVIGLIEGNPLTVILSLVLLGAFGGALPLVNFMMSDAFDVVWDAHGVTGPATLHSFHIRRTRHTLPWEAISHMGVTQSQTRYVESTEGKRVAWSSYHGGYAELESEISERLKAGASEAA